MVWQCKVCGHENPDELVICEKCEKIIDSNDRDDMPDDLFEDEDLLKITKL